MGGSEAGISGIDQFSTADDIPRAPARQACKLRDDSVCKWSH